MSQITQVRIKLLYRVVAPGSNVSKVAKELGIHRATLWRFLYQNYEPETPTIRRALGLEEVHE